MCHIPTKVQSRIQYITYIPRRGIIYVLLYVIIIYGIDPAINFDLVNSITKNLFT